MERPVESLTLREKLIEAAHVIRDLTGHLDQAFVPRVHNLRRMVKYQKDEGDVPPVSDATIRNQVVQILESERYSLDFESRLDRLCTAIQSDSETLVRGR